MHGEDLGNYAYGLWTAVAFNTLLVLFFVTSYIVPKKNVEWRSMGAFIGFIAALFTEMYGFPLTIYLLSSWMGQSYPVLNPFTHNHGHLWLVLLGLADSAAAMTLLHIISNGIVFFGFYIIYKGWILIYDSKGQKLVTEGVYSYVRHPQYSGLFLITVGFLLQWPSLTTLVMWPILMFSYYRLAMREERDVAQQFGKLYEEYKKQVPAFFPRTGKGGGK
ncbi:MAG: isoprenylcysteine carboxylmethyltransferase family protein [Candidatus Omnitrophota bacterium]